MQWYAMQKGTAMHMLADSVYCVLPGTRVVLSTCGVKRGRRELHQCMVLQLHARQPACAKVLPRARHVELCTREHQSAHSCINACKRHTMALVENLRQLPCPTLTGCACPRKVQHAKYNRPQAHLCRVTTAPHADT